MAIHVIVVKSSSSVVHVVGECSLLHVFLWFMLTTHLRMRRFHGCSVQVYGLWIDCLSIVWSISVVTLLIIKQVREVRVQELEIINGSQSGCSLSELV